MILSFLEAGSVYMHQISIGQTIKILLKVYAKALWLIFRITRSSTTIKSKQSRKPIQQLMWYCYSIQFAKANDEYFNKSHVVSHEKTQDTTGSKGHGDSNEIFHDNIYEDNEKGKHRVHSWVIFVEGEGYVHKITPWKPPRYTSSSKVSTPIGKYDGKTNYWKLKEKSVSLMFRKLLIELYQFLNLYQKYQNAFSNLFKIFRRL